MARKSGNKEFCGITGIIYRHQFITTEKRVIETVHYERNGQPRVVQMEWDWGEAPDRRRFNEMVGQPVTFLSILDDNKGKPREASLFRGRR